MTELEVIGRLRELAVRFIRDGDLRAMLAEAVGFALATVDADAACLYRVDPVDRRLLIASLRGLDPAAFDRLAGFLVPLYLRPPTAPPPGAPLVIDDVGVVDDDGDGDDLTARARDALGGSGMRALQATPLRGRSGELVGVLATLHGRPHRPDTAALGHLGVLAGQCADALVSQRGMEERAQRAVGAQWAEKVRESEELFRTTVENIPLNLFLCDRDGQLLYLNPALARLVMTICNKTPDQLIGRHGSEIWPAPIWNPLRTHIERAVSTGERQTYELASEMANGQRMVRQWTVVPLAGPDGEVRRILAMSHDTSAQRQLVDELRQADQRKSDFIAMLSHELRNPLAAIRSSLFILENAPDDEPSSPAQARGIIDRQVDQLVRLVDDLLDVSRIARHKMHLQRQRLDLNQLVRATIDDNREHLERGGVRLIVELGDAPVPVEADGARIAQVVTNLLSNAAKFTPAGGWARVSVARDAQGWAVLTVADSGPGLDPALLPRLFQPFTQGDRTRQQTTGGLGLGLALVKGLVELHGGDVRVESAGPSPGAAFIVRLPSAPPLSLDAGAIVVAPTSPSPLRVLIVEDDADIAQGLRVALSIDAHEVAVARDGAAAVTAARAFRAQVVLCDIGLPGMSGYQVAEAFRADEGLRATYLVAMSGYAQAEDLARSRAAGFDEHLAKPARIERIRTLLASVPRATPPRA